MTTKKRNKKKKETHTIEPPYDGAPHVYLHLDVRNELDDYEDFRSLERIIAKNFAKNMKVGETGSVVYANRRYSYHVVVSHGGNHPGWVDVHKAARRAT